MYMGTTVELDRDDPLLAATAHHTYRSNSSNLPASHSSTAWTPQLHSWLTQLHDRRLSLDKPT